MYSTHTDDLASGTCSLAHLSSARSFNLTVALRTNHQHHQDNLKGFDLLALIEFMVVA